MIVRSYDEFDALYLAHSWRGAELKLPKRLGPI